MEKRVLSAVFDIVLCLSIFTGTAAGESFDDPPENLGIMRPTDEEIKKWQRDYADAPEAPIDEKIKAMLEEGGPEAAGLPKPLLRKRPTPQP